MCRRNELECEKCRLCRYKGEKMAKTIKFNLDLDGYQVRTLEDVQEHFSIEDLLKYYNNGLLERWLKVREYEKQLEEVKEIQVGSDKGIIVKKLIKIFDMPIVKEDIDKAIAILDYLDEMNRRNVEYKKYIYEKRQLIKAYHEGYRNLICHMEKNKDNMMFLKADTIEMEREYVGLFALDSYSLYFRLYKSAPKALFCILSRDIFRKYWFEEGSNIHIQKSIEDDLITVYNAKRILKNDLKIVKKDTKAMWDKIEPPEVKIMVLSIADGTFIKNANNFYEKLGKEDVDNKLIRLKGLEYQCNYEEYELLYIEV